MAAGFQPGKDFELPKTIQTELAPAETVLQAPTAARATAPMVIPRRVETPQRLLMNTKSKMVHLMKPEGDGTVCPYVRNIHAAHFKQEKGRPEDHQEYQKCPRCYNSVAGLIADVEWDIQEDGLDQLGSPTSSSGTTEKGSTTDDAEE